MNAERHASRLGPVLYNYTATNAYFERLPRVHTAGPLHAATGETPLSPPAEHAEVLQSCLNCTASLPLTCSEKRSK